MTNLRIAPAGSKPRPIANSLQNLADEMSDLEGVAEATVNDVHRMRAQITDYLKLQKHLYKVVRMARRARYELEKAAEFERERAP